MFSRYSARPGHVESRDAGAYPAAEESSDRVPLVSLNARKHNFAIDTARTNIDVHSHERNNLKPALGKPKSKRHIEILDALALLTSLTCCALAIVTVSNSRIAWWLRYKYQIVVIGFLLSIMNLCLGRVVPYLLVLLEARFGRSTLQNYDGLLLNQFLRAKLALKWRAAIFFLLALPLGLSAAYKTFDGGSTSRPINATDEIGGDFPIVYGLYAVPDIYAVRGNDMGLSIYFNASSPFRVASNPRDPTNTSEPDPPLPAEFPHSYGFNTLVLNDQSTALLDLPWNYRLQAMQDWLRIGDSLNITADVNGTVAERNTTPAAEDPEYLANCLDQTKYNYYGTELYTLPKFWIGMVAAYGLADYSTIWLGFVDRNDAQTQEERCDYFQPNATRYDITRRRCRGTWSVTRGGIQLVEGSCEPAILPSRAQECFTMNSFFLGERWMSVIAESVGLFSTVRYSSQWRDISLTTMVAGMLWSAVVGLNGYGKNSDVPQLTQDVGDRGVLYTTNETVTSTRETLQSVPLLYVVLVIPLILTVLALILSALMYSVPLDKGFGMVSILAGIDQNSLGLLQGASFSGELKEAIHLHVTPGYRNEETTIQYEIAPAGEVNKNGKVKRRLIYS